MDDSRNKLDLTLYCLKHPKQTLRMSTNLSKVGANSAYEVNLKVFVHPCMECQQELNNLKWVIRTIKEVQAVDLKDDEG